MKALLRLPLGLPVVIFGYLLQGSVAVAIWAAVLVGGRIPRWLFDFQVAANRWLLRAASYLLLLTDEYPPFEGDYPIRYEVEYPERVSRWRLVVWKFITSIPHFFVLAVLALTLVVVVPIGWFAILFTGRFPEGLHGYVAGILRWQGRVQAYVLSLTDEVPPFSLSADAGAAGATSYRVVAGLGVLAAVGAIGLVVTILVVFVVGAQRIVVDVSYEELLAGDTRPDRDPGRPRPPGYPGVAEVHSGRFELRSAVDPADEQYAFLAVRPDFRLVELRFVIENYRDNGEEVPIRKGRFELQDNDGGTHEPLIATVNGSEIAPFDIESHDTATLQLVFELPAEADPLELEYDVLEYISNPRLGETIVYEFR